MREWFTYSFGPGETGESKLASRCSSLFLLPKHICRCLNSNSAKTWCRYLLCCEEHIPFHFNGCPPLLLHWIGTLKHSDKLCVGSEGRSLSVASFANTNSQSWLERSSVKEETLCVFPKRRFVRLADLRSYDPISWMGCLWCWYNRRENQWCVYVCVYWLGGCSHEALFIKTTPSVCTSLPGSLSQTLPLFFYLFFTLSHKKHLLPNPNRCPTHFNGSTSIIYMLLKKVLVQLSAALYSFFFFGPFPLFLFLLSHLSSSSLLHFGRSSLACHSLLICVTQTWWQLLILHSTERKVEQAKAQLAGSCVSFSMCP